MNDTESASADVKHALDREVELVMSAVNLVATGGAPSSMVIGLRLTDSVLEIVRPVAAGRGVIVEPMWGPDETTSDIRVRRATSA